MTATTTISHATPAQPTAKKARRKAVMRYPYQMHCAVTPQMHLALERLGNPLSLLNVRRGAGRLARLAAGVIQE
jgi:hypothetical protein